MTSPSAPSIIRGISEWRMAFARAIHKLGYHTLLSGVSQDDEGRFAASAWCLVCGLDVPTLAPSYAEAKAIADAWRAEDAAELLSAARSRGRRRGGPRAKRSKTA